MYAVQEKDFLGQWVEVYRAARFDDAERYKESLTKGSAKREVKVIQIS